MFWAVWKKRLNDYFTRQNWSNRKIAFVAILIAVSVVFVLVMTSVLPFLIWPSLRLSVGGLPIKITGYIFGPFIGLMTGVVSDAITFSFRPTYWHWSYMLAFAVTGAIPGIIGYIMNRRWRQGTSFVESMNTKINWPNLVFTIVLLVAIILSFTLLIVFYGSVIFDESHIASLSEEEKPLISNKWVFLGIAISGISTMLVGILIMGFFMKKSTFNTIIPIVAFSALLEMATTPLVTLGDVSVLSTRKSEGYITVLTTHFLTAPVKIWVNLIVIYSAYRIVYPLISQRTANGWK